MATERKRPPKGETLTIRLDAKSRFMLDFIARLRGQTITTVVDRAISDAAERATIHREDEDDDGITWKDVWNIEDGVRFLKLAGIKELYPTYDEEKTLSFAQVHWPFFYINSHKRIYQEAYISILWPKIKEYVAMFDETKTNDYFYTGKVMASAIRAAGVQPPEWPSKPKPEPSQVSGGRFNDLPDDIPF